jgi:outer membrane lipoprotein-sorting protein
MIRLLLCLLLIAGPACAADWDMAHLMRALAQNPGGRVAFVERKYLAVLDKPVESSGELVYVAPSRLERHTVKPKPESVVLDGERIQIERDKRTLNLRLADYPQIAVLIDSIRATLAGDQAVLEKSYALSLSGKPERWKLALLPSDPKLAELVSRITVSGSRGEVRQVEILQADGDRSVLSIGPVAER